MTYQVTYRFAVCFHTIQNSACVMLRVKIKITIHRVVILMAIVWDLWMLKWILSMQKLSISIWDHDLAWSIVSVSIVNSPSGFGQALSTDWPTGCHNMSCSRITSKLGKFTKRKKSSQSICEISKNPLFFRSTTFKLQLSLILIIWNQL